MGIKHENLVKELLLALSIQGVRVWPQQTGVAKSMDGQRMIRYGVVGGGDISGIIKCKSGVGARLEIDAKIAADSLRQSQKNFCEMIVKHGGLYIEARDVQSVVAKVLEFQNNN